MKSYWKPIVALLLSCLMCASAWAGTQNIQKKKPQFETRGQEDTSRFQDRLVREVRHELLLLPYYSVFDNLAYKVDGDRVALIGQVTRPVLKSDAEAAVKKIEGVTGIDNQIEVLPPSPIDDQLRSALFRTIYSSPPLQKYVNQAVPPIHIIVKSGHVTLEGVVANEADKNVAGIQANSVPNVFSVTNNLQIENK